MRGGGEGLCCPGLQPQSGSGWWARKTLLKTSNPKPPNTLLQISFAAAAKSRPLPVAGALGAAGAIRGCTANHEPTRLHFTHRPRLR